METEDLYVEEREGLRHAWNLIQECKAGLPLEAYNRITKVLTDLDAALFELHPPHTSEEISIYNPKCGHCTGRGCV